LLPAEKIRKPFDKIKEQIEMEEDLHDLLSFCIYVENTWINSSIWPPENWSMFMQMRRTNNHVEGFHNSVRVLVNSNSPNLVKFIGIVRYSEAESIDLQAKLLSQNEALSNLRKDTLEMQHCLSTFWQDYNDQRIGSEKLLQLCAALFAKHNRDKFRTLIDDQVYDDQSIESP
jgi:hypothetical protein